MEDHITSSMNYWFPKIPKSIPVPKTKIAVTRPVDYWWGVLDKPGLLDDDWKSITNAVHDFNFPIFLRSDLASGKHRYIKSCYVENEKDIAAHVYDIIEYNAIADLPMTSLVVREYLELDWQFKAFYGELPIAPERRYFIQDGEVICHHHYWVEDSIQFPKNSTPPENWKAKLAAMNSETEEEFELLSGYASEIAQAIDGSWSVDFAKTSAGTWICIDMALAQDSYHDPSCHVFSGKN